MKKIWPDLDFSPGRLVFDDFFSVLNEGLPVREQLNYLKEDLLQVEYPNNCILDVGWYPSFDEAGEFQVRIIQDEDWMQPIYYKEAYDLAQLYSILSEAIALGRKLNS